MLKKTEDKKELQIENKRKKIQNKIVHVISHELRGILTKV